MFEAILNNVAFGTWCPACKYKTQRMVNGFIATSPYGIMFDGGNVPLPGGTCPYRIDWIITTPRGVVAVELDGVQHFTKVAAWGGSDALAVTQARDAYKMLYWLSRGARFIRLHQEDIFAARFGWQAALKTAIDESTDPVVCLESDPSRDTWAHLRAEVQQWWGRPVEEWYAANGARLDAAARGDEETTLEIE
jgi:hypothetical protein